MKKMTLMLAAAVLALCTAASAQTPVSAWPVRPVTLLVPFPAGGSTDLIARTLGARLQERLGGTFIVENRAGAGGTVGVAQARRAPPDGQTILVTSLGPLVIGPHLMRGIGYDPLKDFDPITVAVQAPNVLAVPAGSPHRSVGDVLKFLKAQPDRMTFASAGNGTSDHLTAELFWQETGTRAVHVPYKGGAAAMSDLIGGVVDASFMNINTGLPSLRAGKLRALAVTSAKRSPQLPDVPTMEELGLKDVTVTSWQAFAAPKGLAPELRARLHSAITASLHETAVKGRLLELGFEIVASTPEQFAAFQAAESQRWKRVIDTGKITAD
ncbi:MAG: hypothetical protein RLZZ592_1767 [Pseudomonadota bacterium]|jgi:tripartite-type tricarboxylate transporter receptor subunit TctC